LKIPENKYFRVLWEFKGLRKKESRFGPVGGHVGRRPDRGGERRAASPPGKIGVSDRNDRPGGRLPAEKNLLHQTLRDLAPRAAAPAAMTSFRFARPGSTGDPICRA
jgi:hypothetical protein